MLANVGERKKTSLWGLLAGVVIGLLVLVFSFVELVDDAYISFRYSRNFAAGEGLVFNPGEYVEGYTNLLWTLLMAVSEVFGLPTPAVSVIVGGVFAFLALFTVWRICLRLGLSPWGSAAAVVALGAYPDFWMASTMGLEGGLFAALLSASVLLLVSGKVPWAGLLGGLMFATRPESLLLLPVFALYLLIAAPQERTRRLVSLLAPWLVLVEALTLWRLYYYGALLPNTITAKSPPERDLATLLANGSEGARYLAGFAWSASPLVLGALVAPLLRPRSPAVWLCLGCVAAVVPAVLLNGGDWMLNHRLVAPYAPVLAVLLGVAADRAHEAASRIPRVVPLAALALLAAWSAFLPREHWWDPSPDAEVAKVMPCWEALGDAAGDGLRPGDVVAPEALGYFSYANPDVYSHDIWGLTDRHVALHGDYYLAQFGKGDAAYTYREIRPDLMVSQTGVTGYLHGMAHVAGPAYDEDYRTFLLSEELNEASSCQRWPFAVAVRQEDVSRILPAFSAFDPKPVEVPR